MLVVGEKDFKDLALHDINKLFHYRSLVTEDRQKDKETLALLRKEYELYKDQWGLNLKYSHEAGESKNYSKILVYGLLYFSKTFLSAAKIPLDLQVVHIFFDSSTFDKVEKDAKVKRDFKY